MDNQSKLYKMKHYLRFLILLSAFQMIGQNPLTKQDEYVKNKSLYLNYDTSKKQLNYFTKKNYDDQQPLDKEYQFSLKYNYSNIYLSWINPLRYRIQWKDSTYVDDQDLQLQTFVKSFLKPALVDGYGKKALLAAPSIGSTDLAQPQNGINSVDVMELYLKIEESVGTAHPVIAEPELIIINSLLKEVFKLDEITAKDSISEKSERAFNNMFNLDDYASVKEVCKDVRATIKKFNKDDAVKAFKTKVELIAPTVDVAGNPVLASYISKKALEFAEAAAKENEKRKYIFNQLEKMAKVLEASVKERKSQEHEGFYKIRDVNFQAGKVLETEITIVEYEYDEEKKDLKVKGNLYQSKIKFRKSDFIIIGVSAGIFYSSTELKNYGVSSGEEMLVTEDVIEKNNAVTATFLNLYCNVNSRYFAPLMQFGVDPTKKRPFLLAGIGIAIPAANISLSGGPIWTWDAALDKLSVGQAIASTTDLENDIKYRFDSAPKGWYFGIQYDF